MNDMTRASGRARQIECLEVRPDGLPAVRDACDLDVLVFFTRHPRVVLSTEHLAAYVGYDLAHVTRSLDALLGAGLLRRTLHQDGPGRMNLLEVDRTGEWLEPLRRACETPDGRNILKTLLKERHA